MAVYTQADVDRIDAAIGSGLLQRLKVGDSEYEFRSVAEMMTLRNWVASQLAASTGTGSTYRLVATSKGV